MTITVSIDQMKRLVNWKAAVLEVRCFRKRGDPVHIQTFSRSDYDSPSLRWHNITAVVRTWNQRGYNCYAVLNTIRADFESVGNKWVSDDDIVCLDWLFLDFDRRGTHENSATDAELIMARELAEEVKEYFSDIGWDEPVMTCSGNGYHLYFPLHQLPANDETKEWVKKLTNLLGTKFNTEHVAIDPVVYNPSRITKILGTIAHKGEATEDRPHREARLVSWN